MHIKKPTILIVDDKPANLSVVSKMLSELEYEIYVSVNGQQALETLNSSQIDLVLLDVLMPGLNGFDVCEKLKADSCFSSIPVIFLTACISEKDIARGFKAGGVDYITKPFNKSELLARVNTHLELKMSKDTICRQYERIKYQNKRIKKQNGELKRLNNNKDRFLSYLAHELKNPFHILTTLSKILIKKYDAYDEQKKLAFIKNIFNTSISGYSLLENLLQWSLANTGKLEWNPVEADLYECINDNIKLLKNNARIKNISVKNEIPPQTTAFFDENIIATVIRNLLSNAIKFTDHKGCIKIGVYEENAYYIVKISDNGMGIDPEKQKILLKEEQMFTTKGTDDEKGTGLGLLLCKQLVEINKGKLWLESKHGKGSTFFFSIYKKYFPKMNNHASQLVFKEQFY